MRLKNGYDAKVIASDAQRATIVIVDGRVEGKGQTFSGHLTCTRTDEVWYEMEWPEVLDKPLPAIASSMTG